MSKIKYLEGLRGIAAMMVVLNHLKLTAMGCASPIR
jgi:peptidoglycan/LPS O-acetylase OafA/YrhL